MNILEKSWADFRRALQLLTIIPVPGKLEYPEGEGGRIAVWFPVVGLLLALIIRAAIKITFWVEATFGSQSLHSDLVTGFIAVALLALLTRGLHLDGFADTCDGVLARRGREKALEIMRDSRVGSFGVIGLMLLLLGKILLLATMPLPLMVDALLLALVSGRLAMVISAATANYARGETGGLGGYYIDHTGTVHALKAAIVPVLIVIALIAYELPYPTITLLPVLAAVLGAVLITQIFTRILGGITGDTLGAVNEISEGVVLFIFYLFV